MSNEGPNFKEWVDKGIKVVKDLNIQQENVFKAAPYALGAMCLGAFCKRPVASSFGLSVMASLAGPKVLESGRQWVVTKLEEDRSNKPKR